ncbi:hypothetical protein FOVSG1_000863 [Fusarium oxysporum f. sp. vasinfectum]
MLTKAKGDEEPWRISEEVTTRHGKLSIKKAALALPIHSLSLSFLPYNSPTQNRLYTQHASARLCDHVNTTNYFPPSSPPRYAQTP